MLIELNRFMTTEEARQRYRVPDELAHQLLPALPVAILRSDGIRIHLESEVDEFVADFVRRGRPPAQSADAGSATTGARLTDTEQCILEALGSGKLTGEQLAKRAGYPCNSNFKNTLSSLVKRGLLINDRPGYRKSVRTESGLTETGVLG
jgi:hypothetical protein